MPYETGVSNSPSDLLAKIFIRAGTDGWTQIRDTGSGGDGPNANNQHSIADASAAAGFQVNMIADDSADTAHIQIQPSVSDGDGNTAFFDHPGTPDDTGANGTFVRCGQFNHLTPTDQGFSGSSVAYHLFSDVAEAGRYIHLVVEGTTGVFWHLMFGSMDRAGSFGGGQYVTALNVNANNVNWPFQSQTPNIVSAAWVRDDDNFASSALAFETDGVSFWHQDLGFMGYQGVSTSLQAALYTHGLQNFNQRTGFGQNFIVNLSGKAPSYGVSQWMILGKTPDLRLCSMDGREPNEEIIIGSDTWIVFPLHVKSNAFSTTVAFQNTNDGLPVPHNNSGLMGLAYRKTA